MPTATTGPRLLIESRRAGFESTGAAPAEWTATPTPPGAAHPWDLAHCALLGAAGGFEALAAPPDYAEPDFTQVFPTDRGGPGFESGGGPCEDRGPDDFWPAAGPCLAP